jgi:hypothetical protein
MNYRFLASNTSNNIIMLTITLILLCFNSTTVKAKTVENGGGNFQMWTGYIDTCLIVGTDSREINATLFQQQVFCLDLEDPKKTVYVLPLVHHAAHGGDSSAPERPRLPPPAGAPVGALRAQEVAVLHATRRSGAEHGAAHLSAGDRTNSADPQPRCGPYGQGRPAHRCHRLHSPIRLQPERTRPLPRLCGGRGV